MSLTAKYREILAAQADRVTSNGTFSHDSFYSAVLVAIDAPDPLTYIDVSGIMFEMDSIRQIAGSPGFKEYARLVAGGGELRSTWSKFS